MTVDYILWDKRQASFPIPGKLYILDVVAIREFESLRPGTLGILVGEMSEKKKKNSIAHVENKREVASLQQVSVESSSDSVALRPVGPRLRQQQYAARPAVSSTAMPVRLAALLEDHVWIGGRSPHRAKCVQYLCAL